jgi:hypothetical protein
MRLRRPPETLSVFLREIKELKEFGSSRSSREGGSQISSKKLAHLSVDFCPALSIAGS